MEMSRTTSICTIALDTAQSLTLSLTLAQDRVQRQAVGLGLGFNMDEEGGEETVSGREAAERDRRGVQGCLQSAWEDCAVKRGWKRRGTEENASGAGAWRQCALGDVWESATGVGHWERVRGWLGWQK